MLYKINNLFVTYTKLKNLLGIQKSLVDKSQTRSSKYLKSKDILYWNRIDEDSNKVTEWAEIADWDSRLIVCTENFFTPSTKLIKEGEVNVYLPQVLQSMLDEVEPIENYINLTWEPRTGINSTDLAAFDLNKFISVLALNPDNVIDHSHSFVTEIIKKIPEKLIVLWDKNRFVSKTHSILGIFYKKFGIIRISDSNAKNDIYEVDLSLDSVLDSKEAYEKFTEHVVFLFGKFDAIKECVSNILIIRNTLNRILLSKSKIEETLEDINLNSLFPRAKGNITDLIGTFKNALLRRDSDFFKNYVILPTKLKNLGRNLIIGKTAIYNSTLCNISTLFSGDNDMHISTARKLSYGDLKSLVQYVRFIIDDDGNCFQLGGHHLSIFKMNIVNKLYYTANIHKLLKLENNNLRNIADGIYIDNKKLNREDNLNSIIFSVFEPSYGSYILSKVIDTMKIEKDKNLLKLAYECSQETITKSLIENVNKVSFYPYRIEAYKVIGRRAKEDKECCNSVIEILKELSEDETFNEYNTLEECIGVYKKSLDFSKFEGDAVVIPDQYDSIDKLILSKSVKKVSIKLTNLSTKDRFKDTMKLYSLGGDIKDLFEKFPDIKEVGFIRN